MRNTIQVFVFKIEQPSLLKEVFALTFGMTPIKFRQSPFCGEHFAVLTEGSNLFEFHLKSGVVKHLFTLSLDK